MINAAMSTWYKLIQSQSGLVLLLETEEEECSLVGVSMSEEWKLGGIAYYSKGKTRLRMKVKQKLTQKKGETRDSW